MILRCYNQFEVSVLNVLFLLTPKASVACLDDSLSIRQAIEKFKAHGYTATPMISKEDGRYLGTISEGDFLWKIINDSLMNIKDLEDIKAVELLKPNFMPAVKVDAKMDDVLRMVQSQNFVPVVDDRGIFMGIVTRRSVINFYYEKEKEKLQHNSSK